MSWKIFISACISVAIISFPQNIIGCGGETDPYDYYTSFFHVNNSDVKGLKPFYYTSALRFYNEEEPVDQSLVVAKEWADYCGAAVTATDAHDFVYQYRGDQLKSLYAAITKNQPSAIPDSIRKNSMTTYFIQSKDVDALGYLIFAKKIEPLVAGSFDTWEPVVRDSTEMAKMIAVGVQLYNVVKNNAIKLRCAYQVMRLALYSGNYRAVDQYYNTYMAANTTKSILTQLCLSLKAGALYRGGQKTQAAYLYSQAFAMSDVKKLNNFNSFSWSTGSEPKAAFLALCKNDAEKGNMLALFGLNTSGNALSTLKDIATINPNLPALEVLCIREIGKSEENYLTPLLSKSDGGLHDFYHYYYYRTNSQSLTEKLAEAKAVTAFLQQLCDNKTVSNKGFYQTLLAYSAFITADYTTAKQALKKASTFSLTEKLKDQCSLINLLVTLNEKATIDAAFEQQILPSLQWLKGKAAADKTANQSDAYYNTNYWDQFYRNVMNEIIAKQYHEQKELVREVVSAGLVLSPLDFVQNKMSSAELLSLNDLLQSKNKTTYEKFICANFPVTGDSLHDIIATSYSRTYDFKNSILWQKKVVQKDLLTLDKNPFNDLLKDNQEDSYPSDKSKFDKTQFAITMAALLDKEQSGKATAADLYKLASGFYNMTYYGRSWQTVAYYRGGTEGYAIPKNANAFLKDYYGCFTAEKYYNKAMAASADNNFKARCLFMMAKCSQKQLQKPSYTDFENNWDKLSVAERKYYVSFKNNKYFTDFKKLYSTTPFYKTAYNSCSYLRDFVRRK